MARKLWIGGVAMQTAATQLCLICGVQLKDEATALNHSSFHLLCTPERVRHLSAEPCPLCLGSSCKVFLLKTGSSDLQPRFCCQKWAPTSSADNVEVGVAFHAARLKSSTGASPTTNHPIVCPVCSPELVSTTNHRKARKRPAVMTYNLENHWVVAHSGMALPADLKAQAALEQHEKAMLSLHRGLKSLTKAEMGRFPRGDCDV